MDISSTYPTCEMIAVQVGQCGNQLGCALFSKLASELQGPEGPAGDVSSFFRQSRDDQQPAVARAVLVDMEPKVVQQCLAPRTKPKKGIEWRYDARNALTEQSGAGNNWAFGFKVFLMIQDFCGKIHFSHSLDGFHGLTKVLGARVEGQLLELLRSEAERCDLVRGFLTLQSAAGGTGSGLGSLLSELIADEFGSAARLNAVVWPHQTGEVIVQNYNAVLTTASLVDAAHGVLLLQNDVASAACQRLLRIAHPSFDAMNEVLATHLAAALLPVDAKASRSEFPFGAICQQLCAHPAFKLLDIKTVPQMPHRSKEFTTHMWPGLLKHLHQMQVANDAIEAGIDWSVSLDSADGRAWNRGVGSVLVIRGPGARQQASDASSAFRDPRMYASWATSPLACMTSETPFNAYDKSATLISNSKANAVSTLAGAADRAFRMFEHGAYVHQYERHGVDRDFFQQAFLRVDQVVQSYSSL